MSVELELEEARRDYASNPASREHRERLAALNERVPVLDKEYVGLPCAPALLLFGWPTGAQGRLPLKTSKGLPKLELQWRSVYFSPKDEQLGQGFFDPYGPGYFDLLYPHAEAKARKSAKYVGGYALVRFTLDGEPMTLLHEAYNTCPLWDDGSEVGDTDYVLEGPRLSCSGSWLVLAAMCNALPAWDEELLLSPGYKAWWEKGRQKGLYSLKFRVEYLDCNSTMPCLQYQDYDFDFSNRSYTYKHRFSPTWKRND